MVYDETIRGEAMPQAQSIQTHIESTRPSNRQEEHRPRTGKLETIEPATARSLVSVAFEADRGVAKADASRLFQRVAAASPLALGRMRAELIPDSSWKRAGKKLGPQASQTTIRLKHVLSFAERVWRDESGAIEWLNSPHPELQGATPYSLLKTEAGGRAVEALLAALEFGFPV
jgi:putative toxin-antitoxin system antitoxin component (TIGR02293 family)